MNALPFAAAFPLSPRERGRGEGSSCEGGILQRPAAQRQSRGEDAALYWRSHTIPASAPMEIKPPYGYEEIVPLTKQHRVALPDGRKLPPNFRGLNALPLSFTEFTVACRDYPIAFVGPAAGNVIAMVVLGLESGQNLFVSGGDGWDTSAYVPAYARRYPFCMTRVTVDGKEQAERVACVEKRALSDHGEALFDGKGEPLPAWEERRKLLFEYEGDLVRSEDMCREPGRLELLET